MDSTEQNNLREIAQQKRIRDLVDFKLPLAFKILGFDTFNCKWWDDGIYYSYIPEILEQENLTPDEAITIINEVEKAFAPDQVERLNKPIIEYLKTLPTKPTKTKPTKPTKTKPPQPESLQELFNNNEELLSKSKAILDKLEDPIFINKRFAGKNVNIIYLWFCVLESAGIASRLGISNNSELCELINKDFKDKGFEGVNLDSRNFREEKYKHVKIQQREIINHILNNKEFEILDEKRNILTNESNLITSQYK